MLLYFSYWLGVLIISISLFSGTPGSYKSYHATDTIIDYLKSGRNVIANFPIDYKKVLKKEIKGEFIYIDNLSLTPQYLIEFAKEHHKKNYKCQTLVVIDEASIIFNSREFNRKDRTEWIKFLANHRHFNYNFILISQLDTMLDKQIRGLVEYEYKHRALKNFNFITWLLSKICGGLYMTLEMWYPCKMRIGSRFCKFHKKVASCYDTMALFVGNDSSSSASSATKKSSKVVIIKDEQATSNDTQSEQDVKTTLNLNGIDYDTNTGITTINNNS